MSLQLLLLRHGHAQGGWDEAALLPEGVQAVQRTLAAPALTQFGPVDLLLHSPLRRAVETARLVAAHWPCERVRVEPLLRPDTDASECARSVAGQLEGVGRAVLVAHLPLLPALARWWADADVALAPAGACLLEATTLWQGTATRVAEIGGDHDPH
ncbi:MAG: histidine phosphatase family protein [Pseudomonadales bacterium]|nr:histidine phosphatase family protein [Pseudomonadales bacterium]